MRSARVLGSVVVLLVGVLVPAGVSDAARVKRLPLTCGMVVTQDAFLYLKRDLECSSFALSVQFPDNDDPFGDTFEVTVDLRGHTLRGNQSSIGLSAATTPSAHHLSVKNGRIENWAIAATGSVSLRNVELVDNVTGLSCDETRCDVDRVAFRRSSSMGLFTAYGGVTVKRSTFVDNATGLYMGTLTQVEVDRSTFTNNGVGAYSGFFTGLAVSRTKFTQNDTAIVVEQEAECVELNRVRFDGNVADVVGPVCGVTT